MNIPFLVLAAIGGVLVIGGIIAIFQKTRGKTEVEVFGQKLKTNSVGIAMIFLGLVSIVPTAKTLATRTVRPNSEISLGHITALSGLPPVPTDVPSQTKEETLSCIFSWVARVTEARITIDRGFSDGLEKGDFVAAIADASKADDLPRERLGNLQDEANSYLKIAFVYANSSTAALDSWSYAAHLGRLPDRPLSCSDAPLIAPVQVGQTVVAIPREEKAAFDEIERSEALAEDINIPEQERQYHGKEVVRKADDFLRLHQDGFFTGDVLFARGRAQLGLGQYEDAVDSFKEFLQDYPFHTSSRMVEERWLPDAEKHMDD